MSDHTKHWGSCETSGLNQHVRVVYRCTPRNHGRLFIANSSMSVDALATHVSSDSITLVLNASIEPATPVRIEMGDSGLVPYLDLVAHVTSATQVENGKWRCVCKWFRKLTPDELLVSRYRRFHAPHDSRL